MLVGLAAIACDRPAGGGDAVHGEAGSGRPALVAAFPAASGRPGTDDELSRQLHDFQAYLDRVRGDLSEAGVQLLEWYAPEVRLRMGDSVVRVVDPEATDSSLGEITYYFVEPWRISCVLRGVQTDTVLRRAAEECFGISLSPTPETQ